MKDLDNFKNIISKLFVDAPLPVYIKLGSSVYVLSNNELKKINSSDYFVEQLRENKFTVKGKFKDKYIDFYVLHLQLQEANVAFIIPLIAANDIRKLVTHIFLNILNINKELADAKKMLESKEIEISNIYLKTQEKEEENIKLHSEIEMLLEEKKKLENILNGQEVPLFVVDKQYNIIYANNSLVRLLKCDDAKFLMNRKCYKEIYKKDKPCEWCKMIDVYNLQKQHNQRIDIEINHSKYVFEQMMYPVVVNGKFVNIAESINDITEYMNVLGSMEKIDMERQSIAKKNIDNIKEIDTLRKTYSQLYNEYLKNKEELDRLNILTSKLVEFNNVQKAIDMAQQLKEYAQENKLLITKLENYSKKIETYENRINELRQKAIYEVSRLSNVVKNRKEMSNDELKGLIALLEKHINTYIKEENYVD
jgi:PAS domain-containing protein